MQYNFNYAKMDIEKYLAGIILKYQYDSLWNYRVLCLYFLEILVKNVIFNANKFCWKI